MADDTFDNVVELRPDPQRPPVFTENYWKKCKHTSVLVDAGERVVTCRHCGATIDPIDALLTVASAWTHASNWHRHTNEEIGKLRLEEKRIKARISRARRTLRGLEKKLEEADD